MKKYCMTMISVLSAVVASSLSMAEAQSSIDRRPMTMEDIVELTGIGSQPQAYGGYKDLVRDVDVRSPDARWTAVITRKGNIARNSNDYTLSIYRVADLLKKPHAATILKWSSTSNRSAISSLQWLEDNRTLAFLGEQPGQLPQVYMVRIDTKVAVPRTAEANLIRGYEIAPDGSWLIYETDLPRDDFDAEEIRKRGFAATPESFIGDILAGDWSGLAPAWSPKRANQLNIEMEGAQVRRVRAPPSYFLDVSSDGRHALLLPRKRDAQPVRLDLNSEAVTPISQKEWDETYVRKSERPKIPRLALKYGLNTPTQLVAEDGHGHQRVVFDPAPEIEGLQLARVQVIEGDLKDGRRWTGGLYLPPNARSGERYPLVIQTHGFDKTVFAPQGIGPSGNAAQPLAAQGVAVLQVGHVITGKDYGTPAELPAVMAGYEAIVRRLDELGYIDPSKVGLQGWSRTGEHVYYALQNSRIPFAAAFISDAQTGGYFEKIAVQNVEPGYQHEGERLFGARPEGPGLMNWADSSPGFNMHRIRAPVRLEASVLEGGLSLMWEPYARLLELRKPVELYILPDAAHALVKPSERLASANAMVDWFVFWLKGNELSGSDKQAQYERWRHLRQQQVAMSKQ